jgi:uncharacterized protein YkwD
MFTTKTQRIPRIGLALCSLCLCGFALLSASAGSARQEERRLSLDEARTYMLELINRDRAAKELKPVRLDPVAAEAGQRHAAEMAAQHYMSHWDMTGRLPDQRYTEQDGTGRVSENVYLRMGYRGAPPTDSLPPDDTPTFTRQEIEEIEAAYFNETPPYDGHRRNILGPHHTHVGIGLARADNRAANTLANTQEFVIHAVEVDPIPHTAAVGARIAVSGRALNGAQFRAVSLSRGPLPAPMTRAGLMQTRSYGTPDAFVSYWPEPYVSPHPVKMTRNGKFRVEVKLSDNGAPGVYYVTVWLQDGEGRNFAASQRTVVVK